MNSQFWHSYDKHGRKAHAWKAKPWKKIYQLCFCLSFSISAPREGKRWYNLRVVLNKRMLHPRDSAQYGGVINDVVTDFMKRIYYLRQRSPTGDLVTNVANELYHFSLEGMWKNYTLR